MKKVVIHKPGGYKRLTLETHAKPSPADGEVLVKVHASGVNYADVIIRWGFYESAKQYVGYPITPGFEFAGKVEAVGQGVTNYQIGDPVFGVTRFGAYASYISVPEWQVYPIPKSFQVEEAAGFCAVFLTAYHALFQNIVIRPNMTLLVHSAAGGMGSSLLQLGKIAGCRLVGVVGASHKVDAAKAFGADAVIDKSVEDLWKRAEKISPHGFDVILDGNGPATLRGSFKHLAPTGKLISYGFHSMFPKKGGHVNYFQLAKNFFMLPRFSPLTLTNQNKSVIAFNLSFLFERRDLLEEAMKDLLTWIEEGKIQPPKVTLYPVEKVAQAHKDLESGQTVGKLILCFE